jgi:hypothetical protein
VVNATPRPLYARERDAFYRRLDGTQDQSGRDRKTLTVTGIKIGIQKRINIYKINKI